MKKNAILIAVSLFTISIVSAQTHTNRLRGKPSEQSEIKADNHFEKEMQHNQLSAKPELLEPVSKSAVHADKEPQRKGHKKNKHLKHISLQKSH